MIDGQVLPILTDLPPAPESLLHIVRCNCKSGCSRPCGGVHAASTTWNVLLFAASAEDLAAQIPFLYYKNTTIVRTNKT